MNNPTAERPCTVHGLISATMLSSHRVLGLIKTTQFNRALDEDALRESVYLTYMPWAARYPDHVFGQSWLWLINPRQIGERQTKLLWTTTVLDALADEFLESRHGKLSVRLEKFGPWHQTVLSRISGLAIQASVIARMTDGLEKWEYPAQPLIRRASPLLSPQDAIIEDYIEREGLHESHLHLNGSTHAEICWLRALRSPHTETKDFEKLWKIGSDYDAIKTRELAHAVDPTLNPAELFRRLRVAAQLRQWLIAAAINDIDPDADLPTGYSDLESGKAPFPPPLSDSRWQLSDDTCLDHEIDWMAVLLNRLKDARSSTLDRMLHCYLVLQNQYYRLLVQSEEQFGFDQFQKMTFTKLREPTEEKFFQRFSAMHGHENSFSRLGYLEGRIAPKTTVEDNCKLLQAVLSGYLTYLVTYSAKDSSSTKAASLSSLLAQLDSSADFTPRYSRQHHRLTLVFHFIKKSWCPYPLGKAGPYRFYKLHRDLELRTNVLLETLRRWPALHKWVCGIDAAGNELFTPPEVFATYYRICQRAGLTRRSYHAGEDFPHLLTGLRQILDALELLDLRSGDRIGHGTAMGISPQLWIERMPEKLIVKKADWMLDLLSTWRLLRHAENATTEAYRIECELADLAGYIFGSDISCAALERAMNFRYLNPHYVMEAQETSWRWETATHSDIWMEEARLVHVAISTNQQDVVRLWNWLSDKGLWIRGEETMEVDAAHLNSATFIKIQQSLMTKVSERGVVIETLPSSNVRISQYHSYTEHHSLRWMRVPGFFIANDPEIMVSLGSDDPGIFACDLNSEFYQLYAALRATGLGDKSALNYLAPLNERGRQYRFHAAL
ncbi:hypothetical protein [Rhodoferax saidenbachensis]|uniref:Adenosine deaminase n=1 Tax=Rhodoferax saidenbachensis TaxID=1484693 RepID=A0ABU1ZP05_9BURK|nr:hypothetical protein [Rhodoferax saidenbachensis]MDR7307267.1 adenosine deaminase [Rhodoferax saidenbachensis]